MPPTPSPQGRPPAAEGTAVGDGQREALTRRWVASFNARDADALVALAHPDVLVVPVRIVSGREFRGHAGVRSWIVGVQAYRPDVRIELERVRPLPGERTVAEGMFGGQDDFIAVFAFRGELIVSARGYLSDADTLARLGLLQRDG